MTYDTGRTGFRHKYEIPSSRECLSVYTRDTHSNKGVSQQMQWYVPVVFVFQYSLEIVYDLAMLSLRFN